MGLFDDSPMVALDDAAPLRAGGVASRVLLKTGGGSVTALALDAGASLAEHAAPSEALAVVTHGEAVFTMDGQTYAVPAGSAFRLPEGRPHRVDAPGGCRLLLTLLREP